MPRIVSHAVGQKDTIFNCHKGMRLNILPIVRHFFCWNRPSLHQIKCDYQTENQTELSEWKDDRPTDLYNIIIFRSFFPRSLMLL